MVETCKCCGAVIPDLAGIKLSKTQRAIYDYVAKNPYATVHRIYDHLYSDRADGGPLHINIVNVMIHQINTRLVGQKIKAHHRGPGATYQLVKVPTDVNA